MLTLDGVPMLYNGMEAGDTDAREDAKETALRRKALLPTLSLAGWDYRVYAK